MAATIYLNEDTEVIWDKMTDEKDGTFINNATVSFVVSTTSYPVVNAVSNGSGSLTYVTSSDGRYVGAIAYNADVTKGSTYYLQITVTSSGRHGFRELECVCGLQGAGISVPSGLSIG